jgi:hypothetical protein
MSSTEQITESGAIVAAKMAPPATVSLATLAGYQVSEILVWATLIYTVLLIGQKLYQIYKDLKRRD